MRASDSNRAQQFSSFRHRTCWWHSLDDVLRPSGTQRLDSPDRLIRYEVATTATVQNGEEGRRSKGGGHNYGVAPLLRHLCSRCRIGLVSHEVIGRTKTPGCRVHRDVLTQPKCASLTNYSLRLGAIISDNLAVQHLMWKNDFTQGFAYDNY